MNTILSIKKNKFYINNKLTYSEIPDVKSNVCGLLMNSRMIQGIFDDKDNRACYKRGNNISFDPEVNTDLLIASLPQWYSYGLRAITVGLQGGWPVGMKQVENINNQPFSNDGLDLDFHYKKRLERIILAADKIGMIVIVNILYWAQAAKMKDDNSVKQSLLTTINILKDMDCKNVMIDVANEYNLFLFNKNPIVNNPDSMAKLIELLKVKANGIPIGSSGYGGVADKAVVEVSDVVFVHGNGLSRGKYYDFIEKVKKIAGDKPIVCNEDSPCITRLDVSVECGVSWGYYNNYLKQIPPCNWEICLGEDEFFALRMAKILGIEIKEQLYENHDDILLIGLNDNESFGDNSHVLRVSSKDPELINCVEYYLNGKKEYVSYDEPFFYKTEDTWLGKCFKTNKGDIWTVKVLKSDGTVHLIEHKI